MKVRDVIRVLEEIAPRRLADDGDKIGLQVGDADADVSRIIVTVDATPSVVDYAVDSGANMLVCHHPVIYHPVQSLVAGDPASDMLMRLVSGGVAAYAMHTNYDSVSGGINDVLAEKLGVYETRLLTTRRLERLFKIAVYVPEADVDAVRDAMAQAGAGNVGNYSYCSFRTPGTGTFMPLPGSDPYIGDVGALEELREFKLEMIVPEWVLLPVLDEMLRKHPYEEVAYDIIALENRPLAYGYGRVGRLKNAMKLGEFRDVVEDVLNYRETRMVGDPDIPVEIVALCGGAGGSLIREARAAGANVYVTGDVGHHTMLEADAMGLAVIDAGHYPTERPGMEALAMRLSRQYAEESVDVEFIG